MHNITEHRVVATPNMTPMIDVMLVLLIIFMVVTPLVQGGVIAEPPVAEHLKPKPPLDEDHTLAIDRFGMAYLDREPIEWEALESALRAHYPPERTNRVLYVNAHHQLEYRVVRDAMHAASRSGVAVVGLVSEQRDTAATHTNRR